MTPHRKPASEPTRPLRVIAAEISKDWPRPYFAAAPYLRAMHQLDGIHDSYGAESGKGVVLYFLGNANMWRGETAKRIKAELKAMVQGGGKTR